MPLYVLDTSAVMCILYQEAGFDNVVQLLQAARNPPVQQHPTVLLPFIALMETEYWLLRHLTARETERTLLLLGNWPVQVRESTPRWRRQAARVKAQGQLSVADAWIAALAIQEGGVLVHKDPEFDEVSGLHVQRLPYRKR